MQTTKRLRQAALLLCLGLGLPAALPIQAQEAPAAAPMLDKAYSVDLRAYLDSVRLYERMMQGYPRNDPDPDVREINAAFLAWITPDRFYARALPIFARFIPSKQAAVLGEMARKRPVPLGKQQTAQRAYWDMEKNPQARRDMGEAWRGMGQDFFQSALGRATAEMRRTAALLAEHRGSAYMPVLNKTGLPMMDRIVALAVVNMQRQIQASVLMEAGCKGGAMESALQPATVLAENGIATARAAIDGCERAVEAMEKASEAAFTRAREDFAAVHLPAQAAAGLQRGIERSAQDYYDYLLKLGEMNRQNLESQRRVLSLIEAKRSHFHIEDKRFAVDDETVLAELNRGVDEVTASAKATNDFIYQTRQKGLLRNVDLHDGVTAPQAQ